MKIALVFDLEGTLIPNGIDFAKILIEIVSKYYPETRYYFEIFDKYDDYKWIVEFNKYQTGTTPLFVLILLAGYGYNEKFIENICNILGKVIEIFNIRLSIDYDIYVASSAYYKFVHNVCKLLNIEDLSRVNCLGYIPFKNIYEQDIVSKLYRFRNYLLSIIEHYVHILEKILSKRSNLQLPNQFLKSIRISELKKLLQNYLINQIPVCGSKCKKELIQLLKNCGYKVYYFGDSIVDYEAFQVADVSISINTNYKPLLKASIYNVVLKDFSKISKVIECIVNNLCTYYENDFHIFKRNEILEKFDEIFNLNLKTRKLIGSKVMNLLSNYFNDLV